MVAAQTVFEARVVEERCAVFADFWESNATWLGRTAMLLDGDDGICPFHPMNQRSYALGFGHPDECGSVTYEGALTEPVISTAPSFRDASAHTRSSQLVLVDHAQRASRCPRAEATLVLHERASVDGQLVLSRTLYGPSGPPPVMPRPRRIDPPPQCPFFTEAGAPPDREAETCEVGVYFREDGWGVGQPGGKYVELEDWVDGSCEKPPASVTGKRLYALEWSGVDACGSVTYRGALMPMTAWSCGYVLEMLDHRSRKKSDECKPPPARVELVETVRDGPMQHTCLPTRRFYAPRVDDQP